MMVEKVLLFCLSMMPLLTAPAMGQDEFPVFPRPKGPSLDEKADIEWQNFQKNLPSWFKRSIKYHKTERWGDSAEKLRCFYKDQFSADVQEILWKKDGKCFVEKRTRILGFLNTIRYGTKEMRLALFDGELKKLLTLNSAVTNEKFMAVLKELQPDDPATGIIKEIVKKFPIVGQAFGHAEESLGTLDTAVTVAEIKVDFDKFLKEYDRIQNLLKRTTVAATVNGGYDQAVLIRGELKEVHTWSKTADLPREDEFCKTAEEGRQFTSEWTVDIKGKAIEPLVRMLDKVKGKRDETKLMTEIHADSPWSGTWYYTSTWGGDKGAGFFTLRQVGGTVSGVGDRPDLGEGFTMGGKVTGNVLKGSWQYDDGSYGGDFTLEFTDNSRRSITGSYNGARGSWQATKR